MVENLKFPVILTDIRNNLEIITDANQLRHTTKLSFKERKLISSTIFDMDNIAYKIRDVKKIGDLNPWWKFEFFNPMVRIELILEKYNVSFLDAKEKIILAINSYPEFWNAYDLQKVIGTIEGLSKMSDVTVYLKMIRGIN